MSERPWLVVVGGFLGAGKTTLILAATRALAQRGLKSAVILNDQGDMLVDTQFARHNGINAAEVTGGCFCCRFSDLMDSAETLRAFSPDVIFAEPVGSCTDVSATVLRPLRENYSSDFRLAPFTVCIDPARAREIESPDCNPHFAFLFRNQLDEADLFYYTKADLYPDTPLSPPGRRVSAVTGEGVAAWLDELFAGQLVAGSRTLDIDYGQYARAEAALAWMNLRAIMECRPLTSPAMLLGPLLDHIAAGVEIVHLKATDYCDTGFLKASLCGNKEEPRIEGALDASPALSHDILINLRAAGNPAHVRAVVEESMADLAGKILYQHLTCFTPAPPKRPQS
jgi:hypothetical protein